MRTRLILTICALGICLLFILTMFPHPSKKDPNPPSHNMTSDETVIDTLQNDAAPVGSTSHTPSAPEQATGVVPGTNSVSPDDERNLQRLIKSFEQGMARASEDWKKPISFYGKMVDENEQPVEGVNIGFVWSDLSPSGTSKAQTMSDINGLFSLAKVTGRGLSVEISKPGYYLRRKGVQFDFEYARDFEPTFHRPAPNNPVVFRLRKKGPGTDLVTSAYGVKRYFGVSAALDGTPVHVDLLNRKVEKGGALEISQTKPDFRAPNPPDPGAEWSFRMTIPSGGFIEHNDEFPFEAPERGYMPVVEFHFKAGAANWTSTLRKQYYIAFGHPRRYGRLNLDTVIEMRGARLEYAINPDGSRNLEPK